MATDECDAAMAPQPEIGMARTNAGTTPNRSNLHELIHKQLDDLNRRLIEKDNEIAYLRDQNGQLKLEVARGTAYGKCADAQRQGVINLYTEERLYQLFNAEKRHG